MATKLIRIMRFDRAPSDQKGNWRAPYEVSLHLLILARDSEQVIMRCTFSGTICQYRLLLTAEDTWSITRYPWRSGTECNSWTLTPDWYLMLSLERIQRFISGRRYSYSLWYSYGDIDWCHRETTLMFPRLASPVYSDWTSPSIAGYRVPVFVQAQVEKGIVERRSLKTCQSVGLNPVYLTLFL